MAFISVYNPKPFPVIYGNGQTIGGLEWATVDEDLVQDYLATKRLIIPNTVVQPQIDPVEENAEETSIGDSSEEETDVSSDAASDSEVVEDMVDDAPSDAPAEPEKPATIRKSRRRKRTTTERE